MEKSTPQKSTPHMQTHIPLGERLRPKKLEDLMGQDHLLKTDSLLRRFLAKKSLPSLILWGPPGSGKTTLATLLAKELAAEPSSQWHFTSVSAVFSSVGELRKIFEAAKKRQSPPDEKIPPQQTILFVDEIHRFNRAQQESFLPYVEKGDITLIGATTENPSFALVGALLSRTQVLVLKKLNTDALEKILARAEVELHAPLPLTPPAREELIRLADGDGRYLLNLMENILAFALKEPLSPAALIKLLSERKLLYDRSGEEHFNLISALHKTLRGSDCDAALYYMARMLAGGEDPRYLFRRILRFAYEDIGLAAPQAATYVLTAWQTYERLGSPEGEIALAQSVIYLANAPKSNSAYTALKSATRYAQKHGSEAPPKHILNAPTRLMKNLGYSDGYRYDHDEEDAFSGQDYFPETLERQSFYQPTSRGFEREQIKSLAYFNKLRAQRKAKEK